MKKLFYPIKTVLLTIWLVYPVSLLAQEHPGLFVQLGHRRFDVKAAAFSADG